MFYGQKKKWEKKIPGNIVKMDSDRVTFFLFLDLFTCPDRDGSCVQLKLESLHRSPTAHYRTVLVPARDLPRTRCLELLYFDGEYRVTYYRGKQLQDKTMDYRVSRDREQQTLLFPARVSCCKNSLPLSPRLLSSLRSNKYNPR